MLSCLFCLFGGQFAELVRQAGPQRVLSPLPYAGWGAHATPHLAVFCGSEGSVHDKALYQPRRADRILQQQKVGIFRMKKGPAPRFRSKFTFQEAYWITGLWNEDVHDSQQIFPKAYNRQFGPVVVLCGE